MVLGVIPTVPLEDRVYVDVDGNGGFIYVRYRGGTEIQLTDDDVEALSHLWVFFYSNAAWDQVRSMFDTQSEEGL